MSESQNYFDRMRLGELVPPLMRCPRVKNLASSDFWGPDQQAKIF